LAVTSDDCDPVDLDPVDLDPVDLDLVDLDPLTLTPLTRRAVVVPSLAETCEQYSQEFPDEADELRQALPAATRVTCWAVLCDGIERVFQLKDPIARAWGFPLAALDNGDDSPRDAAASALSSQAGEGTSFVDNSPRPIEITLESETSLRVYYRFDAVGVADSWTLSPEVASRARWTPFDTVANARLADKLMSH
jgi:hypothetical protein